MSENAIVTDTDTTVADTILQQLGGNQFLAMTGAHCLVAGDDYLLMRLTRNKLQATHLRITLNAKDLYDMDYLKVINPTAANQYHHGHRSLARFENLYFDMLAPNFETATGLYTRL